MSAFIDLDTTLRFPWAHDEETAHQLGRAARDGGLHTVVVGIDGDAPIDGPSFAAAFRALHAVDGVRMIPAICPLRDGSLTDVRAIERPPEVRAPDALSRRFSDELPWIFRLTRPVDDALLLRRVGDLARSRDAVVLVPSYDAALHKGAVAIEGPVATRLGLPAMPEEAEAIGVSRIVEIARLTGARFHVTGLFSARGAGLVEEALSLGVTGSVHASHLLLDDEALLRARYDTRLLRSPPLPRPAARLRLLDAVKRGAIAVSSGHRAVPKRERDLEMTTATAGGTALSSTALALSRVLTPDERARAWSTLPAQILGIPPPTPHDRPAASGTNVDDLAHLLSLHEAP